MSDGLAQSPTAEDLARELRNCRQAGVTNRTLLACASILDLTVIRARAATEEPEDRAVAARDLLRELAVRVDGERNGPVATLMGLATGGRGFLLSERRRLVAQMLSITVDHLRTSDREQRLIGALADELYATDSAYRLRHRHRTESERVPVESRLGVDWLERFQAYRRVWTPLYAARNDVWVLLTYFREEADQDDIGDRLVNISWRWAQFQIELDWFIREYGGMWLFSDAEREFALSDALHRAELSVPFGEMDDSWVRTVLKDAAHQELDPFRTAMLAQDLGREMLKSWAEWGRGCACNLEKPEPERCVVHRWIGAVDEVTAIIDEDWLLIADWYRIPTEPLSNRDIASLRKERTAGTNLH